MEATLTLQEQFLLLCLNDQTGRLEEAWVDYGLNGAALMDLLLRGRLALAEKGAVVVQDDSPTGDDLLDRALTRVAEEQKRRPIGHWIGSLYRGKPTPRQSLLERLTDRGILVMQEGRVLWVFPTTRYPARDDRPEHALRDRLMAALRGREPVEPSLAALIALLRSGQALDRVLSRQEEKQYRPRIEAIAAGDAVSTAGGKAVSEAIAAATAAMIAASTATIAATSAGS